MEIKQLEYFLVACEQGSLNKAAEKLFTSQPNVSKVIHSLEKELKYPLFERTSKGLRITDKGKMVQEYANHIIQNIHIIEQLEGSKNQMTLSVSTYPSNMVARILTDLCMEHRHLVIHHQQGTVEEITDEVGRGASEVGVVYISTKQLKDFRHIISHKRLKFTCLDTREACIYVGSNNPLYHQESISFEQLQELRFVRGTQEYFSMEHHLEQVSMGAIVTDKLKHCVYTNSDHLSIDLLLKTDVCSLGINFLSDKYRQYDIKPLRIDGSEPFLSIGYVQEEEHDLSPIAQNFANRFEKLLKNS